MNDRITVLHVDDDQAFSEVTAAFLERYDDVFSVVRTTTPDEGLAELATTEVDCLVSDYDMPDRNGIELLEAARETDPDLPCILYTGKGSEDVASDAISAGVTDYLQKSTGVEDYELLANRITNAVQKRRARDQLEAEREKYRKLVEESNDAIVVIQDRTVAMSNQEFATLVGTPADGIEGKEFISYVAPAYRETVLERHEARLGGKEPPPRYEIELRPRDGDPVPVELNMSAFTYDGRPAELAVIRDIAQQKERERLLKHERDRANALFANSSEPIAYYEFEDGTPITKEVNRAFERTFGVAAADAEGQVLDDILVPATYVDEGAGINERVLDGELIDTDVVRHAADGIRPFNLRSVPFSPGESGEKGFAIYTDLTDRNERERELEQYRMVVETVGDPIYILDADGVITMVNEAAVDHWGYDRETFVGTHAKSIMADEDYERGTDLILELLESDGEEWGSFEMRSITSEGEELVNETKLGVLTDDGTFVGSVGIVRDISTRKAHERELARKNERLLAFTNVVSHDLRTPLSVAKSNLELARTESARDRLADVERALERMTALVDDVLALARHGQVVDDESLEPVPLEPLVEKCWATVQTDGATLAVTTDQVVVADERRLKRVFENLPWNAVEPGSTNPRSQTHGNDTEHGSTSAQTGVGPLDEVTVTVGELDDGFFVEGRGMPGDEREQAAESGDTTSEDRHGVGLVIVEQIADAHGWTVRETTGGDGGVRFEVRGVELAPPSA